ncbi:hypothetical protein BDY24DRAFT_381935 [Mrakia frigida]|uniref:uncharacterized protein n=1 Tax=Mrakia frigida TaxID=29902 RepID=UPI003FCBF843
MMLDFIQEEEVAKRVASPAPIQNPYQSAGLASPSPRRNPRRSVAAESRSSRAGTPKKGANGDGLKVPTALELIEKEAQKESMNSPTPTSKKQKSSSSNSNSTGFSLDGPSTPSRPSASSAPPNDTSTTPTSAPPPKRKAPAEEAPPSWVTDVQPPTVIFAHDAFGGPILGSSSKKSNTSFGVEDQSNQDSEMEESTSPVKPTAILFTSSVDSREKIVEKDFGKKPSFAFDTTTVSSPSSKKSALPSETPASKSINPTSSSPKTIALETDRLLLPNFTFIFSSIITPLPTSSLESQAISEVSKLPSSSLPKFDLLAPPPPPLASTSASGGFNWASAGLAPPPKPSADIWTCGTCGTKSPLEKENCIACEEPRPAQKKTSTAPAPVVASGGGFNWASAGLAPPPKPSSDIWTCDVCGTKSPLDKAKCIACEEPRPVQKPTPAPSSSSTPPPPPAVASGGFNWAASGFAPPPAPSSDVWVCGDCGTKSPKEKEKCIACEAPNPTKKATSAVGGGGGGGFNWGAAGMKAPEKKAGWDCGVCMIRNGEEKTKCASCETERS